MSQITKDNWNYSLYKFENLRAIMSFGAEPGENEVEMLYFVSLLDEENNELHQKKFLDLDDACQYINKKYSSLWDFEELGAQSSGGGCGSCVAH